MTEEQIKKIAKIDGVTCEFTYQGKVIITVDENSIDNLVSKIRAGAIDEFVDTFEYFRSDSVKDIYAASKVRDIAEQVKGVKMMHDGYLCTKTDCPLHERCWINPAIRSGKSECECRLKDYEQGRTDEREQIITEDRAPKGSEYIYDPWASGPS